MKSEHERTIEELLLSIKEKEKKMKTKIRKLDNDDQGRLLLDWNNPHDREWYFNDEAYENRQSDDEKK